MYTAHSVSLSPPESLKLSWTDVHICRLFLRWHVPAEQEAVLWHRRDLLWAHHRLLPLYIIFFVSSLFLYHLSLRRAAEEPSISHHLALIEKHYILNITETKENGLVCVRKEICDIINHLLQNTGAEHSPPFINRFLAPSLFPPDFFPSPLWMLALDRALLISPWIPFIRFFSRLHGGVPRLWRTPRVIFRIESFPLPTFKYFKTARNSQV